MDITINAEEISVEPRNKLNFWVNLTGIDIAEIISEIGEDNILDEISRDKVIEYFGIKEIEE